jgi:type VII secretion integral membrane protein EccD
LAGATTVAAASAVALLAVRSPVFLGLIVASMVAAVGALAVLFGAPEAGAAALVLALLAFGGGLIPALAFRFSRLRLPHLPSDAEQLQEGIAPVPSRSVLASSAIADGYMTALFVCNGLLAASCLTVLTRSRDFGAVGVCVVTSLLLMLHARGLGATWHRLSALLPGGYGLATLLYQLGMAARPPDRLVEAFGVVVLAAALVGAARTLPGRRMLPHWGRAADIVHTMLAVALIPLVLVVLGVFQV